MTTTGRLGLGGIVAVALLGSQPGSAAGDPGASATPAAAIERDGQHDFDFETGHWRIHLKRRLHPLTGSNTWVEFDGTSVTRQIWNGRAQIEEFETTGATDHIEGLTLRTYNPESHQWRLYWANSKDGLLVVPQIGEFKDGVGEFYAQDILDGKSILIRFVWSKAESATPHFEQSFSADGGKSWEVNWITDQTRLPATVPTTAKADASAGALAGQHEFDFLFGSLKYHLKRRLHPLTGSNTWTEASGTSVGYPIWDGRANLNETKAGGANGELMGLTLRTFNPKTRQWYLYWANSRDGSVSVPPQIGEFKNGVGEFYATDTLDDRAILVRFVWTGTTSAAPHFEQAFSADGGKSWEVNWISESTR
ncbi:MAG TPA: hypothetical protein VIE42_09395 [Steroidobacteraceae bacterium]|jgi:hypothetical protein